MANDLRRVLIGRELETVSWELAAVAQAGQSYGDQDYIVHPLAVAELARLKGFGSEVISACLLHDCLEDTDLTLKKMYSAGIPDIVICAVYYMTSTSPDPLVKVALARQFPLSHVGKTFDSTTNRDQCRQDGDMGGVAYYQRNIDILSPDIPTPSIIEEVILDFARGPEQIHQEIEDLLFVRGEHGLLAEQERSSRIARLLQILSEKEHVKEIVR